MKKKIEFLIQLAREYQSNPITGSKLVDLLNKEGYLTNNKTPFKKGRGVYTLINAAYNYQFRLGEENKKGSGRIKATPIAIAFIDAKRLPAWRFKMTVS